MKTNTLNTRRLLCGAAALALWAPAALAADEAVVTAEADQAVPAAQVDPVIVIGTRQDARLSTGSAVVIDSEELEAFEFTNIHSVLRSAPGVYVREEDGLGIFPRIGVRASASGRSDRISIMEDGIPAAMAPYANTSAYYFPSAGRMSGVEVLKGPEILRYGPQTTSGAINLLSTPIPDAPSGFVNAELGEWGTQRAHAWAGGTFGQFGVLAEVNRHQTDGFQRIDRSNRTAGYDLAEYMLKLRWRSPEGAGFRQQVDLKLFKGDNDADVSYLGLTDADFRADPDRRYGLSELERMSQGREAITLQHQAIFTPNLSLTTTIYRTETYRNYTRLNQINGIGVGGSGITSQINRGAANAAFLQGILDGTQDTTHANGVRYGNNFQSFVSDGLQLEGRAVFSTGPFQHELMGGVRRHEDSTRNTATISNVSYRQVNGSLALSGTTAGTPNRGVAEATSFWIADRIRYGNLIILPLIRHEDIETRANIAVPTSARNSLTKTTWGLGLNYQLSDRWTVLGGVHQGFAPPGNGAVEGSRGEESTNFEGGLRFRNDRVSLDVIGFFTDYDNALRTCMVANPCADGSIEGSQQDGAKEVYGVEVSLSADLYEGEGFRIPALLAYTYTDGEFTRAADVTGGVQQGDVLDYTPRNIGRILVGLDHDAGFNVNLALNYSDGACINTTCGRVGVDTRFLRTQSLFTADLSGAYDLTDKVEIYARAENLFDERRITHRGADGARGNPGRYLGAGLRVRF